MLNDKGSIREHILFELHLVFDFVSRKSYKIHLWSKKIADNLFWDSLGTNVDETDITKK